MVNPPPQANAAQYGTKKVEYAGFFTRFVGLFFDWFYAGILNVSTIYLVGLIVNFDIMADDSEMSVVIVSVIGTIVYWLWYALWESSAKQATPGKMIVGIMITDLNSNRISFARATGRFFGKIISAFSLGIGFLIAVFTEKKQALHDIMAGTLVVKKR
ncbi:RDD family protein [Scytonema sp. UIC 10036]|nr:RDD family protein [Scytonema sp. UIC 10036]